MSDVDDGVSMCLSFVLEVVYAFFSFFFFLLVINISASSPFILFMPYHIMTYCNGWYLLPLHILTTPTAHRNFIITR